MPLCQYCFRSFPVGKLHIDNFKTKYIKDISERKIMCGRCAYLNKDNLGFIHCSLCNNEANVCHAFKIIFPTCQRHANVRFDFNCKECGKNFLLKFQAHDNMCGKCCYDLDKDGVKFKCKLAGCDNYSMLDPKRKIIYSFCSREHYTYYLYENGLPLLCLKPNCRNKPLIESGKISPWCKIHISYHEYFQNELKSDSEYKCLHKNCSNYKVLDYVKEILYDHCLLHL
jgi:hypothetical protein